MTSEQIAQVAECNLWEQADDYWSRYDEREDMYEDECDEDEDWEDDEDDD